MRGTWQTTGGGGGGGGGLALAVIAAAVLIGSGAVSAAVSALVTVAIIVGAVLVLAVAGVVAWLVYRARSVPAPSDRPGRPVAAPVAYQLPPEVRPQLEESHKPAIEPPRETARYRPLGDQAGVASSTGQSSVSRDVDDPSASSAKRS